MARFVFFFYISSSTLPSPHPLKPTSSLATKFRGTLESLSITRINSYVSIFRPSKISVSLRLFPLFQKPEKLLHPRFNFLPSSSPELTHTRTQWNCFSDAVILWVVGVVVLSQLTVAGDNGYRRCRLHPEFRFLHRFRCIFWTHYTISNSIIILWFFLQVFKWMWKLLVLFNHKFVWIVFFKKKNSTKCMDAVKLIVMTWTQ